VTWAVWADRPATGSSDSSRRAVRRRTGNPHLVSMEPRRIGRSARHLNADHRYPGSTPRHPCAAASGATLCNRMVTQSRAVFAAIADPTRRAILDALTQRERSAGEIAGLFPVSRPAVSRHLRVLRGAGLV